MELGGVPDIQLDDWEEGLPVLPVEVEINARQEEEINRKFGTILGRLENGQEKYLRVRHYINSLLNETDD